MDTFKLRNWLLRAWLVTAGVGGVQTPGLAQNPEFIRWVVGTVEAWETGDPLAAAIVRIEGHLPVVTDASGYFQIDSVRVGSHAIEVEYLGRVPVTGTLVIGAGELVSVVIRLKDAPIPLEGLDVVVEQRSIALERAGFYVRRDKSGISATRFTRWEIEERTTDRITDLLQNIPSVRIMSVLSPPGAIVRMNRQGDRWLGLGAPRNSLPGCEPAVYLDDLIHYDDPYPGLGRPRLEDMDFISPLAIEGIEVYTGLTAPARYDAKGCGVILIWTRGYR